MHLEHPPLHLVVGVHPQEMDRRKVTRYARAMRDGWPSAMPPVIAQEIYGGEYGLEDGHHRVAAAHRAGLSTIPVVVVSEEESRQGHEELIEQVAAWLAKRPRDNPGEDVDFRLSDGRYSHATRLAGVYYLAEVVRSGAGWRWEVAASVRGDSTWGVVASGRESNLEVAKRRAALSLKLDARNRSYRSNPRRARANPTGGDRMAYRSGFRDAQADRAEGRRPELWRVGKRGWGKIGLWRSLGYGDAWENRSHRFGLLAAPSFHPNRRRNPQVALEETVMGRFRGAIAYGWTMLVEGRSVGDVTGWIEPGGTLRVTSIAAWKGARTLGAGTMHAFTRELRRIHPEVRRFTGHHVGGWRLSRQASGSRPNPAPDAPSVDGAAARAWEKFHLRSAKHAQARKMPWVKGMAPPAELGLLEGLEVGSRKVELHPGTNGPILATDPASRRLFLIAWKPMRLPVGPRVKAVWYFPRSNSGKYDRSRGFRHEFGEGGRRPRGEWSKAYPRLRKLTADGLVWELVDGEFTVEDRGIVG